MTTINIGCIKDMACSFDHIDSIAFDGCGFAVISNRRCGITKLNEELCCLQRINTDRKYKHICFDTREDCYWAITDETPTEIYKLDLCFCEIGMIRLCGSCGRHVCGISCDPCNDTLLLCFFNSIERVDKCNGRCENVSCIKENQLNLSIQALCGGYLLAYLKDGIQHIMVKCNECDKPVKVHVPSGCSLEGMFLRGICIEDDCDCVGYKVGLLLLKHCDKRIVEQELFITCCESHDPPCPPYPPHPPIPPCPPHPPVPPCPPRPPHPPFPPVIPCLPCCCGKYEIMHSVALEEAGIAHILNAEGEKLQRAVAECSSIEELLAVNESVRKTITQISILESQLFSKLDSLSCICDENDPCSDIPCPCCDEECPYCDED